MSKRLSYRFSSCERGSVVVEFALLAPLMLILMVVLLEAGRMLYHASIIEKHLYAASELAAHSNLPLDSQAVTRINNMAKRGSVDTTNPHTVPGWQDPESSLNIAISYYDLNGEAVPVITLQASVPYIPLLGGLGEALGFTDSFMEHQHAQIMH